MRVLVALSALLVVLAVAASSSASSKEALARKHYNKAVRADEAGDYLLAVQQFSKVVDATPTPQAHYNLGVEMLELARAKPDAANGGAAEICADAVKELSQAAVGGGSPEATTEAEAALEEAKAMHAAAAAGEALPDNGQGGGGGGDDGDEVGDADGGGDGATNEGDVAANADGSVRLDEDGRIQYDVLGEDAEHDVWALRTLEPAAGGAGDGAGEEGTAAAAAAAAEGAGKVEKVPLKYGEALTVDGFFTEEEIEGLLAINRKNEVFKDQSGEKVTPLSCCCAAPLPPPLPPVLRSLLRC